MVLAETQRHFVVLRQLGVVLADAPILETARGLTEPLRVRRERVATAIQRARARLSDIAVRTLHAPVEHGHLRRLVRPALERVATIARATSSLALLVHRAGEKRCVWRPTLAGASGLR